MIDSQPVAHQSVLLESAVEMLRIQSDGVYIDGTFGRGGHAAAIMQQLGASGRLYAIDRDYEAIEWANEKFSDDSRFAIQRGSYDMLKSLCNEWDVSGRVCGVLLDLGVSSPQLDSAARGFSFMKNGPLDMRMDNRQPLTAAGWLAVASARELADVFWQYGEERHSRRIARQIVVARNECAIETTHQLVSVVEFAVPVRMRDIHKHPATRIFQALRIYINNELEMLESVLDQAVEVLASGGRLVVISFHSLEDRIVKRFMRNLSRNEQAPIGVPLQYVRQASIALIGKPVRPSDAEIVGNMRARSAIMRVAEKL